MSRKNLIDPFTITGVSFSIIISFIIYINGLDTTASTLIGLLGITITLQIDQIARFERTQTANAQYGELLEKMEKIIWLYPLIQEIVHYTYKTFQETEDDYFLNSAKMNMERCRNHLQNLSHGYLTVFFDEQEPLINATNKTKSSLRAISVVKIDGDFWQSSMGQRYWETNKQAIKRGVKLERIFIYDACTDELEKLVKKQVEAGVKVYTVESAQVPPELRIDMIIFDVDFTYEAKLNSDGVPIENIFSINKSDINQKVNLFYRLRTFALERNNGDKCGRNNN
ncbi:hypothetical protein GMMP13_840010 [Candidatus Magnetomoraceae bacterium gMMP-13]